jgi:hypothetical protein
VIKQLKILTYFAILMLIAQSVMISFGPFQIAAGNSNLVADAIPPSTFGNTAIGTHFDQNDPNAKSASNFTCASNGQITDIYAYIARTDSTGTGEAAIYADDSGHPGALIAQSNAESITTSFSWVDFKLPTVENVTSGTVYWLSICSDGGLNLYEVVGSGIRVHNGNTYSRGFSDPFGSIWGEPDPTGAMSIYTSFIPVSSKLSVTISPPSANIVLGGFQQFTSAVTGGGSPYSYQWFLNDTAVSGGTSQNWFFTATAIGNYKIYLNITDAFNNQAQSNIVTNITVYPSLYNFSIMQITDTQFLSSMYPNLYNSLCKWIVNYSGTYNLKMVVHTGDIVDQYYDSSQWVNANASMNILTKGGVPYLWCAGNHDQNGFSDPGSGWVGNQYSAFDTNSYNNKSYWVSDDIQGKNTAVKFSVGNYNFLIIDLESMANNTAISWATNLLNLYSAKNYNIIVCTHAFLNQDGGFDNGLPQDTAWETNLQNLLNNYPNVFMTLNGHAGDTKLSFHNTVNGRTQIHWDWQTPDNETGACAVRIYSFNLNTNAVAVSTYSVNDNQWYDNSLGNNFTFSPNLKSFPTVSINPNIVGMYVGQSQTYVSSVSGGIAPYFYQWYYSNGTAITGATTSTLTFKANSTGAYNFYLNATDNLNNKAQSNTATINVYSQPTVTINPTSVNMTIGNKQQFNSTVTGGLTPYTYQWYLNGSQVSSATGNAWTFNATTAGTYIIYLKIADNLTAISQSNNATARVEPPITVNITPTQVEMHVGQNQTFSSFVSGGTLPYAYQWYLNGSQISNANSINWTFIPTSAGNFIIYLRVSDNNNAIAQSNNVTIPVGTTSVITGFNVQNGGSGYTTPAVILTGGGGTGATATARVSNGVIFGMVLTSPGGGYTSAPTVIIRDPNPRAKGAAATAILAT